MKFYLSGGMEYKTNLGVKWRIWIAEELKARGHGSVDPTQLEAPDDNDEHLQHVLGRLKMEGRFDEIREIARRSMFRKDVFGIQMSDAIIVFYDESVQRGAGTISEAWEAFREGKPVYVITKFSLDKIPTWLIGETSAVFTSFEEFLAYSEDEPQLVSDLLHAREIRKEVLSGIY